MEDSASTTVIDLPWNKVDKSAFLKQYWQKKPVLFKNALGSFADCIAADEIIAEAYDSYCPSRLIIRSAENEEQELAANKAKRGDFYQQKLETIHGPFENVDIKEAKEACRDGEHNQHINLSQKLEDPGVSLLVQQLQSRYPVLLDLERCFGFIPSWRREDVMASVSSAGGGVGKHADRYDVFLVQTQGIRRWQVALHETSEPVIDQLTYPGDVLYIPPGVFHWGETIEAAITLSVGFRAPSAAAMLSEIPYALAELSTKEQDDLFKDLGRNILPFDSAITPNDISQARELLTQALDNDNFIADILGRSATFKSNPEALYTSENHAPDHTWEDAYSDDGNEIDLALDANNDKRIAAYSASESPDSIATDPDEKFRLDPLYRVALYKPFLKDEKLSGDCGNLISLYIGGEKFSGPDKLLCDLVSGAILSTQDFIDKECEALLEKLEPFLTAEETI